MTKKPNLSPEWEEEVIVSPRTLELKKKQVEFEKKKASGEFDLEPEMEIKAPKKAKESHILKWIILALVAVGLALLVFIWDLL